MVRLRRLAWIAGFLALVASLAVAYGAYVLAGYSWDQVVSYETPFGDYDRPWIEESAAQTAEPASEEDSRTPRVVLIMIDGLRDDVSRGMSSLETLRGYGADMTATTPQPSLSYPTWTNIMSGAPPDISGVTTNWFEGGVPVETLIDVALADGRAVLVSATEDFVELYDADRAQSADFFAWEDGAYLTTDIVNSAIALEETEEFDLAIVYVPDIDEAAHEYGLDSQEFQQVVTQVDSDVARLVENLQDERTTFVVTADHGHIEGGGHGGWEDEVIHVPALFFGPGAMFEQGEIAQSDIAPTIAAFLGTPIPRHAVGRVRADVVRLDEDAVARGEAAYRTFAEEYALVLDGTVADIGGADTYEEIDGGLASARADRLAEDRAARLPMALVLGAASLMAMAVVLVVSWRAGVAALAGAGTYYVVYNILYFVVHGHRWSLSAFNTETYVETFFNIRMIEAALAGLAAAVVAGIVYPLLRKAPRGPRGSYLGGWLSLGPATVLVVQATLGLQVAWFIWAWGAQVTWRLPDLQWGFKYDLDLIQMTALGASALLAPLVTYLVGRYHPRVRRAESALAEELSDTGERGPIATQG